MSLRRLGVWLVRLNSFAVPLARQGAGGRRRRREHRRRTERGLDARAAAAAAASTAAGAVTSRKGAPPQALEEGGLQQRLRRVGLAARRRAAPLLRVRRPRVLPLRRRLLVDRPSLQVSYWSGTVVPPAATTLPLPLPLPLPLLPAELLSFCDGRCSEELRGRRVRQD